MSNVTLLKALSNIDEQYLIDYEEVLERRNRINDEKPKERVIGMKFLSPVLAVAVIAGIIFMVNPKTETPIVSDNPNIPTIESEEKIALNINKLDYIMSADMDAEEKVLNGVMIPYFEYTTGSDAFSVATSTFSVVSFPSSRFFNFKPNINLTPFP